QPSFIAKRLRSLGTLVVLGLALVVGTAAMQLVTLVPDLPGAARIAGVVVTGVINIALFLVVFQVLNPERHPWRQLLPGAVPGGKLGVGAPQRAPGRPTSQLCGLQGWRPVKAISSTDGPVASGRPAYPEKNAGIHSTRWRTTSRAVHPSQGAGLAHASEGTAS